MSLTDTISGIIGLGFWAKRKGSLGFRCGVERESRSVIVYAHHRQEKRASFFLPLVGLGKAVWV